MRQAFRSELGDLHLSWRRHVEIKKVAQIKKKNKC